ncbi:hypothetical protein, partial [Nocardia sp. CC201C]|uniref:hypothetical protein n=1 Tax=Nocardia sp. CC201C TaxID=3044575 RepID=UPI0024A93E75
MNIWIAATTYFTAAFALFIVLFSGDAVSNIQGATRFWILYALPFPACSFAGYHLILFGTGVIRSKSIEILEESVVSNATRRSDDSVGEFWSKNIGSRAETGWTNYYKANGSKGLT